VTSAPPVIPAPSRRPARDANDVRPSGGPARTFLKLGGALLTEKAGREAVRADVLARLADEVAAWPGSRASRLVLFHGSGSFAHVAAGETRFLARPGDPDAFARVAASARRLNALVVDALIAAGLPAVGIPGGLVATCADGRVASVRSDLVEDRLVLGLVPALYGDAAPDSVRGSAIASTEPLMIALTEPLAATRIILATDVDGVFSGDPHADAGAVRLEIITPADRDRLVGCLGGARSGVSDVTGGMASKVLGMIDLVTRHPKVEVLIVSGLRHGAVMAALEGDVAAGGTVVRA